MMSEILILTVLVGFGFILCKFGYNRGFNKGYEECKDYFESCIIDEGT